ncbi:hypothetical protein HQ447_09275 [bacterium]|nr:hypothetical protein [bacterium]
MKSTLPVILIAATLLSGCGESKSKRAQRASDAADRSTLLEIQRQDHIQRRADRDQRTLETVVEGIDIITR